MDRTVALSLALLSSLALAGCGAGMDVVLAKQDKKEKSTSAPTDDVTEGVSTDEQDGTSAEGAGAVSTRRKGVTLSTSGACAMKAPSTGAVGSAGAPSCQVLQRAPGSSGGVASFMVANGNRGEAGSVDGALVLQCEDADKILFQAAIRCFRGSGDYTLLPGDVLLGAEPSDRQCVVGITMTDSAIGGFIDCPPGDGAPASIFAQRGLAAGLGSFALPRTF